MIAFSFCLLSIITSLFLLSLLHAVDQNHFSVPALQCRIIPHRFPELLRIVKISHLCILSRNLAVSVKEKDTIWLRIVNLPSFFWINVFRVRRNLSFRLSRLSPPSKCGCRLFRLSGRCLAKHSGRYPPGWCLLILFHAGSFPALLLFLASGDIILYSLYYNKYLYYILIYNQKA